MNDVSLLMRMYGKNFPVYNRVKDRFRGFGVLTTRKFCYLHRLRGRSHNSVSAAVLQCRANAK